MPPEQHMALIYFRRTLAGVSVALALLFPIACVPASSPDWQDLTALDWQARQGFEPQYTREGLPADAATLRIQEFPVRLNSLFQQYGHERIVHYTLAVDLPLSTEQLRKPLAIYLAWIGEAWTLYINGELVEDHLRLDADGSIESYAAYRGRVIGLPPGALRAGRNQLVIHLAGHASLSSTLANDDVGLFYRTPYVLGEASELYAAFNDAGALALCSAYAFFALLLFILYLRLGDSSTIWAALVFLSLATEGFMKTGYIYEIFSDTASIARIKFAAQAAASLFTARFHRDYLGRNTLFLALNCYGVLFALGFLSVPYGLINPLLVLFHASLPFALGAGLVRIVISARKQKEALFELLAVSVLATGVVLDILDDLYFRSGIRLALPGTFAYFLLIVLSRWRQGVPTADSAPRVERAPKYSKSKTSRVDVPQILERLDALMSQERLYCDEDLSLAQLAEQLGLSAYQLSEILNKERSTNFATFINQYRVDEARRLLLAEPERSVLSIGYAVGFNSRSRFNAVFKDLTGETPSRFRDSH